MATLTDDTIVTLMGYDLVATVSGPGIVDGRMICKRSNATTWKSPRMHEQHVERGHVIVEVLCCSPQEVRERDLRPLTVDDVKKFYGNDLKAKQSALAACVPV